MGDARTIVSGFCALRAPSKTLEAYSAKTSARLHSMTVTTLVDTVTVSSVLSVHILDLLQWASDVLREQLAKTIKTLARG